MPFLTTYKTQVHADWVDYNGHMRDAFYLLIFSYATDALMDRIGLNSANREATGNSLFTVELHLNYLHEVKVDTYVEVQTQIIGYDNKRIHLYHSLNLICSEHELAGSEQMLLHVNLEGPQSTPFSEDTLNKLKILATNQSDLPKPKYVGRVIGMPVKK